MIEKLWALVDPFVEGLISTIAAAVGVFPFVGGILAAVTTLILNYVYGQVKSALGTIVLTWVEDLGNFLLEKLLNKFFPIEDQEEPVFDWKNGVNEGLSEAKSLNEDTTALGH